jgi:hypothetical protein
MLGCPQHGAKPLSGLRRLKIYESIEEDFLAAKCNPKDCEARGQAEP